MDRKLRTVVKNSTATSTGNKRIVRKTNTATRPLKISPNPNNASSTMTSNAVNEYLQEYSNARSYLASDLYMSPAPAFNKMPMTALSGYSSDPEVDRLIKRIQIADYTHSKAIAEANTNAISASAANNHEDDVDQEKIPVYRFKCSFSGTVSDAMRRRGWVEAAEGEDWNIYWCDMNQFRELYSLTSGGKTFEENQRVGHFKNSVEISRKNLMVKNLKRLKSRIEKSYGKVEGEKLNFFPTTFVIPEEHIKFVEEFRRNPALWIIKPAAGAQGRGIYIFSKLREYYDWRARFDPNEYKAFMQQQVVQDKCQKEEVQEKVHDPEQSNTSRGDPDPDQIPDGVSLSDYIEPSLPGGIQVSMYVEPPPSTTPPEPDDCDPNDPNAILSNYVQPPAATYVQQNGRHFGKYDPPVTAIPTSSSNAAVGVVSSTDYIDFASSKDIDVDTLDSGIDPKVGSQQPQQFQPPPSKHDIYVIQRYIANPYLLGGRKFDIRLYVLVQSFIPLKAWIYRDGFARFSGGQFSLAALQDIYVHLTNVAIQRTSDNYNHERGSKWSLLELRQYLLAMHGREPVNLLMNAIDNIIIRTLQSVQYAISQDKHCFEIYGFDILIDRNLKPWLLEVNASPAFTPSSEDDYRLKCSLIDDAVHVLDVEGRLTGFEKRIGGFDLFWNDGPVYASPSDLGGYVAGIDNEPKLNSFLGCYNDRVNQLYEVFRSTTFVKEAHRIHTCQPYDEIRRKQAIVPDPSFISKKATKSSSKPTTSNSEVPESQNRYPTYAPVNLQYLNPNTKIEDPRYRVPDRPPTSISAANIAYTTISKPNVDTPLTQLKHMNFSNYKISPLLEPTSNLRVHQQMNTNLHPSITQYQRQLSLHMSSTAPAQMPLSSAKPPFTTPSSLGSKKRTKRTNY